MFKSLYKKCLDLSAHKSSKYYLAIVSFIESSFFPIPPDVMVIPMVISKKSDFIKIFNLYFLKSFSNRLVEYKDAKIVVISEDIKKIGKKEKFQNQIYMI